MNNLLETYMYCGRCRAQLTQQLWLLEVLIHCLTRDFRVTALQDEKEDIRGHLVSASFLSICYWVF